MSEQEEMEKRKALLMVEDNDKLIHKLKDKSVKFVHAAVRHLLKKNKSDESLLRFTSHDGVPGAREQHCLHHLGVEAR